MCQSVVEFVKPCDDAVEFIAVNMRAADVAEVWAAGHHTPIESLRLGLASPGSSAAVWIEGVPCAILGMTTRGILSDEGVPWMLCAEQVMQHKREILRHSEQIVQEMLETCPRLTNYVHAANKVSVRWLKWLGFTIDPPEIYGVAGELFHRFHRVK